MHKSAVKIDPLMFWRRTLLLGILLLMPHLFAYLTPASGSDFAGEVGGVESAHPVSVVEADIYVNRRSITMRLKCFAEDLEMLQGVEPLEDGFYDPDELQDATQDHAEYLAEKITIRDANGELMKAKVTEIVDFEIPEEGIRAGTLMNFQLGFVLEYSYKNPPEFITLQQEMVADGALLPSELKILLKQAGSDTPYMHMMKPSQPETFQFDWDKPILTQEASEKEWEQWFAEQREKNLGITSYSSVYTFIYITNYEVRVEVLVPLATLSTLMEFEREDESFLSVEEQIPAAKKIEAFFSVGNPVAIDSVVVQPVFDRIDFYGLDLRDFAMQAEKRRVSMASGRVGVIMSYSTKGPPSKVEVTWDKFNDVMKSVDVVSIAYDKVEKTQFTMFLENNTYTWEEPNRKPLPPITGVASTFDLSSLEPPIISVPVISTGLIGVAALALILLPWFGMDWKHILALSGLLAVIGLATTPYAIQTFDDPFADPPVFNMPDEDAGAVFAQLHKNMFRAFDYHRESDIYDALAKSVDGELLRKLYLDINRSMEIKEQGGAVAHIDSVNLLEGERESREEIPPAQPAFGYRCTWNLIGTIEHWGHIHERTNQYDAEFVVELRDDAWKITSMQVVHEEPGQVKTSTRKY